LGWVLALSLTLGRGPSLAASFVAFGQCGAVFRLFVADSFMKYLLLWSLAPAEISVSVPRFRRQVLVGAGAGAGYRFPMPRARFLGLVTPHT